MKYAIMQLDGGKYESWFVLQSFEALEQAKDKAKELAMKRDKSGKQWPRLSVFGIRY